jgi:hypothetical protein
VYRHLRRVTPALMMIQRTARELNAWSKLKHPNVLELLGLAQFHDCLAMVSPWMEYGSVMAVIQKSPHLDRYKMVSETYIRPTPIVLQANICSADNLWVLWRTFMEKKWCVDLCKVYHGN